jgi:hypothetical protein
MKIKFSLDYITVIFPILDSNRCRTAPVPYPTVTNRIPSFLIALKRLDTVRKWYGNGCWQEREAIYSEKLYTNMRIQLGESEFDKKSRLKFFDKCGLDIVKEIDTIDQNVLKKKIKLV